MWEAMYKKSGSQILRYPWKHIQVLEVDGSVGRWWRHVQEGYSSVRYLRFDQWIDTLNTIW